MLTQKEQLGHLAEKMELVNDLAWIAHDLLSDEDYTKENAAEAIVKVINRELSYVSKVR
ncbi:MULTISPECIES: hypothetical protein [Bacillus cereus group]|uniref:hypothetical protein n=1 Tax=Bacillus cereus group TaxID=86661 RepID=UPI0022E91812|nr:MULTISPECIES: hypothetical protein [unclassified Bacillus cereus group]MDA2666901.1 hypothetical protein [Bacillus cereus group sp. Bc032]MDA2677601.1 hypothetical protein [Bacillus cereus group sp. Bc031]MDA2683094.1 hypothetical protein [Bacillus cereus group sp. Bc029]MDA2688537.1 hypothetical protein [Bacillus cereus group sp. Bc030]MDA2744060.1 hypothetical protein [Bacillus cereus group sp. Bc011]